ncbi:helix-turn-helix domain-containing protein [Geobacter sp. AOG1]|uniref:helix-turn-helix domain-containing protein n=1 Tax=Geobacter sp. AOG1 TaxID=1566346 RepID=UPI001CC617FF|nr:helix-turn-helix transcriptional regulator [Geobacter sp. AOG1]
MEIREAVGMRLKELRLAKCLSQEKLALEADIDRTYTSSVENGRRNISIINLQRFALVLGVSIREFFDSDLFEK